MVFAIESCSPFYYDCISMLNSKYGTHYYNTTITTYKYTHIKYYICKHIYNIDRRRFNIFIYKQKQKTKTKNKKTKCQEEEKEEKV